MLKNLSAMQETRVRSLGWEDSLEKGMAAHSSIFAWKIPWTEESGGVQSRGLQRVGHNRSTFASLQIFQLPPNHPEKNFTWRNCSITSHSWYSFFFFFFKRWMLFLGERMSYSGSGRRRWVRCAESRARLAPQAPRESVLPMRPGGRGPSRLQSQVRPHPPGTGSGTSRHAFFPGWCQSGPMWVVCWCGCSPFPFLCQVYLPLDEPLNFLSSSLHRLSPGICWWSAWSGQGGR